MSIIKFLDIGDFITYKEKLIELIYESNLNNTQGFYNKKDAEKKYEEIRLSVSAPQTVVYGAFERRDLVGFVWAYNSSFRDDKTRLYVEVIQIDKNYSNSQIISQLLEEVEHYAKRKGYNAIFLHIDSFKKEKINLYKKNGYEIERIQLVKKNLSLYKKRKGIEEKISEVQLLNPIDVKANFQELQVLFRINTQAHILSKGFDKFWISKKIKELEQYIKENKAKVWGYFLENKLVAFLWVFPYLYEKEYSYMLNAITVLPEYRNRHIAKYLFNEMEYSIAHENIPLYTYVDAANVNAFQFYLSCGMRKNQYQFMKKLK